MHPWFDDAPSTGMALWQEWLVVLIVLALVIALVNTIVDAAEHKRDPRDYDDWY